MVTEQQMKKRAAKLSDSDLIQVYEKELEEGTNRLEQKMKIQIELIKAQTKLMTTCMEFDYELENTMDKAISCVLQVEV